MHASWNDQWMGTGRPKNGARSSVDRHHAEVPDGLKPFLPACMMSKTA
eukprot:CAMPEP_0194746684 /NCGR_PEP_ID=MMETSP0323_2-20130528/657_1 /TAXON_ID=2866 ORGANISM="Crypthecodinium cohnii, Strain Seligo" /NCGR_SAMPLE_ID=MMETSP0323_2 /ASSEMBLY_ACC=CAM_ASM_000346 /LENGTH=47 /DNA_ID= /DNA_START= /DNA_END= /DNA_ORIENTATION=